MITSVKQEGNEIVVRIAKLAKPRVSSTGKSLLIATASEKVMIGDEALRLQVNIFKPNKK